MSKIQAVPLGKRVIIQPHTEDETTSFGLVLSDANKEKPMKGTIIALSEESAKLGLTEGNIVLFKKYSPTEFTIDNQDYYVLDTEDLLAKL
ncbi:co-chaperone GroES [Candidatus Peregrinibacteria bacterium]|nr:MAG: co-chaperone GroES [Candidatus Peregrinibacteria bacterium]